MILVYTMVLTWAGAWWLPWWWVALAAALVAFWRLRRLWRALPQAFLGGALAWFIPALWRDAANESLLSGRMAQLFHLPGSWGILFATAVGAGIMALTGAFIGQRLRKLILAFKES
jgi:hypothetical protein